MIFYRESVDGFDDGIPWMPRVKLGDFGLAQVTTAGPNQLPLAKNPTDLQLGTVIYKPPETPWMAEFDTDWNRWVFGPDQPYTEKYNVWQMGNIMFDMMTLLDPEALHNAIDNMQENEYFDPSHAKHKHLFERPIPTEKQPEYGEELRYLIQWCPGLILSSVRHREIYWIMFSTTNKPI